MARFCVDSYEPYVAEQHLIQKTEMGRAYSTYGEEERYIKGFGGET